MHLAIASYFLSEAHLRYFGCLTVSFLVLSGASVVAQQAPPPAVGIAPVEMRPITESTEYLGRVQAMQRVAIQPRVTAFLTERRFKEGAEVKKGDLLYLLEQDSFKADVQAKQAAVDQVQAQLKNANLALDRAQQLLKSAGTEAAYDDAKAAQESQQAQLLSAMAQLRQSQIDLAYTEIYSPIDGKIGLTAVTEGNVVSPASGSLTTVVSQDPMYVTFSVPVRSALEIQEKVARAGGFDALRVLIRLPNGEIYDQTGRLDFQNNSVSSSTDTLTLRAVIPNPADLASHTGEAPWRELLDSELVTVLLQGSEPVEKLTVPRTAVLADQGGDYVFVVDENNKAQRRDVKLEQAPFPTLAVISSGLKEGEHVIAEGVQRVRAGQPVSPAPLVTDTTPTSVKKS
ncbi:efflux RND transporter periplasmic adaptor subunit [Rhizobium sp. NPDC090279]|uniref:efflux RND transporter periplasmic adaptor subunit n=1 Tax=Rhizobium sp. NPDC090279 TaxID=3364499 RepID=UPI00383BBFA0